MKDYYKILGITPASSSDEIKKAYRMLAFRHHPDRNAGDTASEELFKEIAESYDILGDNARRKDYDYLKANPFKSRAAYNPYATKTSATFLIIFRDIKNKVFHAGGYINKYALFKVIDDVLSEENITFLVGTGDVLTINLIIDEILIAGVFLSETSKEALHGKLLILAAGDPKSLEKVGMMTHKSDRHYYDAPATAEPEKKATAYFFILLMVFIIVVMLL